MPFIVVIVETEPAALDLINLSSNGNLGDLIYNRSGINVGTDRKLGNPVDFYKENYKGLTRYEVYKKDSSLYQKLCETKLLKRIPL